MTFRFNNQQWFCFAFVQICLRSIFVRLCVAVWLFMLEIYEYIYFLRRNFLFVIRHNITIHWLFDYSVHEGFEVCVDNTKVMWSAFFHEKLFYQRKGSARATSSTVDICSGPSEERDDGGGGCSPQYKIIVWCHRINTSSSTFQLFCPHNLRLLATGWILDIFQK